MSDHRTFIVGESNPYGSNPDYALYPLPAHATGGRLAKVLGLTAGEYLDRFERRNLLRGGGWSAPKAREAADALLREVNARDRLVLLGARVAAAFGVGFRGNLCEALRLRVGTAVQHEHWVLVAPHPSGRSREWNDPAMPGRVRAAFAELDRAGKDATIAQAARSIVCAGAELTPHDAEEVHLFTAWLGLEARRRAGEDPVELDRLERQLYPEGVGRPTADPLCPTAECAGDCDPEAHGL